MRGGNENNKSRPRGWRDDLALRVPAGAQVAIAFGSVLVLLIVVGGVAYQYTDPTFSKCVGLTESELVAEKGLPSWEGVDDEGRRIVVYEWAKQTNEGTKIRHRIVYIEKGEAVTSVSTWLHRGHKRISSYRLAEG